MTLAQRLQAEKAKHPKDTLLLFRMGDFYEALGADAVVVSRKLGLTLMHRKTTEESLPMAGFPVHQLEGYVNTLRKTDSVVVIGP